MKQSYKNNFVDIRKSVLIARDIIKMNNFKRVAWKEDISNTLLIGINLIQSKDDVYERDFVAENGNKKGDGHVVCPMTVCVMRTYH